MSICPGWRLTRLCVLCMAQGFTESELVCGLNTIGKTSVDHLHKTTEIFKEILFTSHFSLIPPPSSLSDKCAWSRQFRTALQELPSLILPSLRTAFYLPHARTDSFSPIEEQTCFSPHKTAFFLTLQELASFRLCPS